MPLTASYMQLAVKDQVEAASMDCSGEISFSLVHAHSMLGDMPAAHQVIEALSDGSNVNGRDIAKRILLEWCAHAPLRVDKFPCITSG